MTEGNIERTLGRIEAKVDQSLKHHEQARADFRDLFKRVRSLERTRAWIMGAFAVVMAGVGWTWRNWFGGSA